MNVKLLSLNERVLMSTPFNKVIIVFQMFDFRNSFFFDVRRKIGW